MVPPLTVTSMAPSLPPAAETLVRLTSVTTMAGGSWSVTLPVAVQPLASVAVTA